MIFLTDILNEVIDANLLEQDLSRIVYVDMDGVLVNFDKGFEKISGGVSMDDYIEKHGKTAAWKLINSKGSNWWANLEWMPDGTKLWSFVQNLNVKILSSATVSNSGGLAKKGKMIWIENHLGKNIDAILVDSSVDKQRYARPGDILIDDLPSNIDQWIAKGGIGILHKSAASSIEKLQKIINTQNETYGYSWSNV